MKYAVPSILLAFFAIFSAIMTGMASPVEGRAARDVFTPAITSPTPGSSFKRGSTITVGWDTSILPANTPNVGSIVLARPQGDSEGIDLNHTLASGFKLIDGHANITWPTDVKGGKGYALVLFGDSGNIYGPYNLF